jgi:hypothetical protein
MDVIRREQHGVLFYFCDHPSWRGTAHGFSTRVGGVSPAPWDSLNLGANRGDEPDRVEENFHRFCAAIGADVSAVVKNRQIHSDRVRPVTLDDALDSPAAPGTVEADGLVTDVPGVCLTVFSGDCIPVLFYDPVRRVVAAVHAGWRGTAAGIAARAVEVMARDYGCAPGDILAAIGPGISPCCFQTHRDVPDQLLASLGADAEPYIRPLPGGETYAVDLKGANARWLARAGLSPDHIAVCSACTACQRDLFWSHRAQGNDRGSMAAMIQLLTP